MQTARYGAAMALLLAGLTSCRPASLTDAASLMSVPLGEDPSFPDPISPGNVIHDVPLRRLICQPGKYHGQRIRVSGYITLAFEGNSICIGHDATECLWLQGVTAIPDPGFRKARGFVDGTFDGELRGHFGSYPGSIVRITRIGKS